MGRNEAVPALAGLYLLMWLVRGKFRCGYCSKVEKRALEVWGTEEDLIKQHELRDENRDKTKLKKYNKNLKQLRMETRSSLFDRTSAVAHTHTFGEERYNEPEDMYEQNCLECGFLQSYEKM